MKGEKQLVAETDDRFARLSRRGFLKAGTFFALMPSLPLPAFSEAIAPASQDSGPKRPPDAAQPAAAPEWTKDLIIYEVATKGFSSPNGPESETFASLRSKLTYLQELGITGLGLTGG